MAGDWIPMRHGLERERETLIVAARLSIRPDFATGLMRRFWCWASDTTTDGFLSGMSFEIIDQSVVDYAGFCEAMSEAGWLVQRSNGVRIPNFDHWLSANAKARLGEAKRKRLQRAKLDPEQGAGQCPRSVRTKMGLTEQTEKRRDRSSAFRESKNSPPGPDSFAGALPDCLPDGDDARAVLRALMIGEPAQSRLAARVTGDDVRWTWQAILRAGKARDPRAVLVASLDRQYGLERMGRVQLAPGVREMLDQISAMRARRGA